MPGGPDMSVAPTPGGSEASNEDGTATCNICYKVHKNYKAMKAHQVKKGSISAKEAFTHFLISDECQTN